MSDKHPLPTAADFMTRHVHVVTPEMSLADVIQFLLKHRISNAPVVEPRDGKHYLVGFISERDCLATLAAESFFGSPSPPQVARTMMRVHPVCVAPETELYTLASIFVSHGYRHLPVVVDGALAGIVSRRDILRTLDEEYRRSEAERADKRFFRPDLSKIVNLRFVASDR